MVKIFTQHCGKEMANEDEKDSKNESEKLYAWISEIPLSKSTKNLTRDFSDAVMMAEIIKVYYPRYVDLHNYVPTSNLNMKKENWNTLNRKVLSKINMKLTKDIINQLVNCIPGAVENVLLELKKRIPKDSVLENAEDLVCNDKENDPVIANGKTDELNVEATTQAVCQSTLKTPSCKNSVFVYATKRLYFIWKWLISLLCIWNYFPNINFRLRNRFKRSLEGDAEMSRTQRTSENTNEEDTVPRHVCAQLKQELREIDDIICTLNHKVAYLESAMRLKDLRISNLTSQIL